MSFTEAEFLQIIADGNQDKMRVGATITLSNTYCSTYEVIGTNFNSTTGTVDIMAHTQVNKLKFDGSGKYTNSTVRTWINGTYFNAFSANIRNAAKTMNVQYYYDSYSYSVSDKVKLLSVTELGATGTNVPTYHDGGEKYAAFTSNAWNSANSSRWRAAGSRGDSYYWLRTGRTMSPTSNPYCVGSNGALTADSNINTRGILPVLRF